MPESKEATERSVSGDFDDSDLELDEHHAAGESHHPPGKPGRKKNPNSQAARRDQNRIAQREFRLRKQQRIRDLEARVEILSGGQDEALGEMRNILKDLMAENHTLRGLIRSLAGFIGDGAGGLLPKLGWDITDFNTFINKSETDTAWESFQRRKKTATAGDVSSSSSQLHGQKHSLEEDHVVSSKKSRKDDAERDQANGFPILVSMSHQMSTAYSPTTRPQERNAIFSDIIRGPNASPLYIPQSSSNGTTSPYNTVPNSTMDSYQPSYMSNVNMAMEQPLSAVPFDSSSRPATSQNQRVTPNTQADSDDLENDDDPNKNEAYKLIQYQLDNFKHNPNYCLPLSLRPTVVQKTVPHESVMDNILHPELRDRMILLRARYSLPDCLIDYRRSILLHGDDVLAHHNWEISEPFLRKYGFLIDQTTLNISNRWRKERGEVELHLSDLNANTADTAHE